MFSLEEAIPSDPEVMECYLMSGEWHESEEESPAGCGGKGMGMTGKLEREQETILKMVTIYCNKFHSPDEGVCSECRELLEYANQCVSTCSYGANKPVCGRCPTNCFRADRFARVVAIMRYAGPRMLYKHPLLAISHILDAIGM